MANNVGNPPPGIVEKQLLSMKVMRLKKPAIKTIMPIVCEKDDEIGSVKSANRTFYPNTNYDSLGVSQFLVLPDDFGKIYIGENLKLYINMHNNSKYVLKNIILKVELVINRERKVLKDMQSDPIHSLKSNSCFETTLEQPLFEKGLHIIVCNATYLFQEGSAQQTKRLRKVFKFHSALPLQMKNLKIYEFSATRYYVTMELKNLTERILHISVKFVPSKYIIKHTSYYGEYYEKQDVFYQNMMKKETRRYLFEIEQKKGSQKKELGKIEFRWNLNFGDKGLLQTSPICKSLKATPIVSVEVINIPERIVMENTFELTLRIKNNVRTDVEIEVHCDAKNMYPLVIDGKSKIKLKFVKPNSFVDCKISVIALKSGIQFFGRGVRIYSVTNKKYFNLTKEQIYVHLPKSITDVVKKQKVARILNI